MWAGGGDGGRLQVAGVAVAPLRAVCTHVPALRTPPGDRETGREGDRERERQGERQVERESGRERGRDGVRER